MQNQKKPSEALEIFTGIQMATVPAAILLSVEILGKIEYPVSDKKNFEAKLIQSSKEEGPEEIKVMSALNEIFAAQDFPLLTLQSAVEKLNYKLKTAAKSVEPSEKCNCQSQTSTARKRDYAAHSRCVAQKPLNETWSEFCDCIYLTDNSIWKCVTDAINSSTTA